MEFLLEVFKDAMSGLIVSVIASGTKAAIEKLFKKTFFSICKAHLFKVSPSTLPLLN